MASERAVAIEAYLISASGEQNLALTPPIRKEPAHGRVALSPLFTDFQ